jgi:hypothetical protein
VKDDWNPADEQEPNPSDQKWASTLAYTILVSLNTYPEATRFVSGKKKHDDEFWADSIRGWEPSASETINWRHANGDNKIVRCARVPYIVKTRRGSGFPGRYFLDHLLVGYTDPQSSASALAAWKNDGPKPLRKLGEFLVEDLWPGQINTCRCVTGWNQPSSSAQHGYTSHGAPDAPWRFRELEITPDATVRITVTSDVNERRYLLIGYEGGGGW